MLESSLAIAGLVTGLCTARSVRGGFSGPIGTYLSVAAQLALVAALVLLALTIGWWTAAAFVIASIAVGMVIGQDTLHWWVLTQPVWGTVTVALVAGAWGALYS